MTSVFKEIRAILFWASLLALFWGSLFAAKSVELSAFPVVKDAVITEAVPTSDGSSMAVYLTFKKVRSCDFMKVIWYDASGHAAPVRFNDNVGTRPPSENEVGPWLVGLTTLEGSTLFVQHKCHPLWTQFTKMYP